MSNPLKTKRKLGGSGVHRYYVSMGVAALAAGHTLEGLDVGGLIPVETARIFWSHGPAPHRHACDVYVSTSALPQTLVDDEYFSQRWWCVVGDCDVGWLVDPQYTPEAVFGELLESGFASRAEMLNALRQFAWIDTCSWARLMLARLGGMSS